MTDRHWMVAFAVSATLLAAPGPSSARARHRPSARREALHACVAAYNGAVAREQDGRLREARELWAVCARPTCGAFLSHECGTRYTQLDGDIPTVVPLATDEAGQPAVDVKVAIDGEVVASALDGRALPVDPGFHEFALTSDHGAYRARLLIGQGQRNRPLAVVLREEKPPQAEPAPSPAAKLDTTKAPPAPPDSDDEPKLVEAPKPEPPRSRVAPLTLALGGAGLAGLGGFALLTYWGRKDNDTLAACSPHCPQPSLDHVRRLYIAADVSLGVGIAALAGAYWVHALRHAAPEPEAGAQGAYLFDVQPTRAGAVATISGSF